MTWAQIDFETGKMHLDPGTTKNKLERDLPFHAFPQLDVLLRKQRETVTALERAQERIIPWVFPSPNGAEIKDYSWAWKGAVQRIGFSTGWQAPTDQRRPPHDPRRSAVRNLELSGVPRSVGMKLVGHETPAIYAQYAALVDDDLVKGLEKRSELGKVVPMENKGRMRGVSQGRNR